MKVKHILPLLSLAACTAVFTSSVMAQTPPLGPQPIEFEGEITSAACTASLSTGTTVTLPPRPYYDLPNAGDTAGETPFSVDLNCTAPIAENQFWVHFEGAAGAINAEGRYVNTNTTNPTTNVSFQLLDKPTDAVIAAGGTAGVGGPGANQGGSATFVGGTPGTGSKDYAVRYYAENGLTTADVGAVSAEGTFTVHFH